jgi:hypothetical protein
VIILFYQLNFSRNIENSSRSRDIQASKERLVLMFSASREITTQQLHAEKHDMMGSWKYAENGQNIRDRSF